MHAPCGNFALERRSTRPSSILRRLINRQKLFKSFGVISRDLIGENTVSVLAKGSVRQEVYSEHSFAKQFWNDGETHFRKQYFIQKLSEVHIPRAPLHHLHGSWLTVYHLRATCTVCSTWAEPKDATGFNDDSGGKNYWADFRSFVSGSLER